MNGSRERIAWIILIGSFFICLSLTIAVPIGTQTVIQRATRSLETNVQANQGTVGILQNDNETGALFAGDPPHSLNPNGTILTNATDQALLMVTTPDSEQVLARVQIYGNSTVNLDVASTPRYGASSGVHRVGLTLNSGRLQLTIPPITDRSLYFSLTIPQGEAIIREPGRYSILASPAETQVAVLQGQAEIETSGESLILQQDQRGIIQSDASLEGPLDSERDLLVNGDFGREIEEWVLLGANVEIADQPSVETGVIDLAGVPTLSFRRVGIGHADAGIRQIINKDVTDFESLRFLASMTIEEQSLGVCGQQGSECPIIVRIEYVDANGVDQIWQQGFYAEGTVGPSTPDVCVACPPPLIEHQEVEFQQLVFFESENLLEKLGQQGILPRTIKSITLIVSGHSFAVSITNVALIAVE
jgi:phage terminase large subunit-like protein